MTTPKIVLSRMPPRIGASASRFGNESKPVDPFYLSSAWRAFSQRIKRARGFVCQRCGVSGADRPFALKVNHIVARKDGGADFDEANAEVLCASCDNRTRAQEHRARGRG